MRRTNKGRLNFKRLVLDRLDRIGMTHAELVERLDGRVPPSTVYRFLDRDQRMPIKSDSLETILGVLGAVPTPADPTIQLNYPSPTI